MSLDSDYDLYPGAGPLVVSVPHAGTSIPLPLARRMTDPGRRSTDSDRYVDRLYRPATELGATLLVAHWSRYVVDLNRDPGGSPLYPGRFQTGVCPVRTFDDEPLYRPGEEPEGREITDRVERYWMPYHAALQTALDRTRERHGFAILWDAHSIRDRVPTLFDGTLPDLNLGTNEGSACAERLRGRLADALADLEDCSHAVDGRFTGGFITRHYGKPEKGVHAVQMEMVQPLYMQQDPPWGFLRPRAEALTGVLMGLLRVAAAFEPDA